eukprot:12705118-Prorocentrum_lima.AAC.1
MVAGSSKGGICRLSLQYQGIGVFVEWCRAPSWSILVEVVAAGPQAPEEEAPVSCPRAGR